MRIWYLVIGVPPLVGANQVISIAGYVPYAVVMLVIVPGRVEACKITSLEKVPYP